MVTLDEFSRVVSEIYASATSPENWVVALADIGRVLDGSGCSLVAGEGPERSVAAATVPAEAYRCYVEY